MSTATVRTSYERNWTSKDAPPHAFDPEQEAIFLNDSLQQEAWGKVFEANLLVGLDEQTLTRIQTTLAADLPPGSFIQFALFAYPSAETIVTQYLAARDTLPFDENLAPRQRDILQEYVASRAQMFSDGASHPIVRGDNVLSKTLRLFIAIRQPTSSKDKATEENKAIFTRFNSIRDGLSSIGLGLRALNEGDYLALIRKWLKPFEPTDSHYDNNLLLGEQWLAPGDSLDDGDDDSGVVRVNDNHVAVLSLNHLPKAASASMMGYLIGDPIRGSDQIGCPYVISWAVHIPNPLTFTATIKNKQKIVSFQAFGPMLRYVRKLAALKEGLDVLADALDNREMPVEMNFSVLLYAKTREEVLRHTAQARSFFASFEVDIRLDKKLAYPTLRNTIPLFTSTESIAGSYRWKPMALNHAAQFLPVIGEWIGTHSYLAAERRAGAALLMLSRRRQPMLYDLYDSTTSFGAVICAESGSGKTYLCNMLALEYLSKGAKVWLFDKGYSFEGLTQYVEGSHITIREESGLCFNPFTRIAPGELPEYIAFLSALLAKMAAPRDGLNDVSMRYVEEAIKAAWANKAQAMTITDVAEYLSNNEDPEIRKIGLMLEPYTARGAYAHWFEGENNMDMENALVTIESQDLENKPELREVLLMQMLARIADDMKTMPRSRPKILLFDEARDFLESEATAKVLERFYSQVRKHNGAPIIVLQSLFQLYNTPVGRIIESNAPNRIVLKQLSVSIQEARATGKWPIGEHGYELMQSVALAEGKYAEAFFFNEATGWGVGRIIAAKEFDLIFDTRGPRREALNRLLKSGMTLRKAVAALLALEEKDLAKRRTEND